MSAQSEIIAMKACGRSIYAMIAPVFLLAMLASVFSLFINFYYAPAASYAYKNAIKNVIRNNPLRYLRKQIKRRNTRACWFQNLGTRQTGQSKCFY